MAPSPRLAELRWRLAGWRCNCGRRVVAIELGVVFSLANVLSAGNEKRRDNPRLAQPGFFMLKSISRLKLIPLPCLGPHLNCLILLLTVRRVPPLDPSTLTTVRGRRVEQQVCKRFPLGPFANPGSDWPPGPLRASSHQLVEQHGLVQSPPAPKPAGCGQKQKYTADSEMECQ